MDEQLKRRERRRAGGVDNGIPFRVPATGCVHATDAIKRVIHVWFAADPPDAPQLKIP